MPGLSFPVIGALWQHLSSLLSRREGEGKERVLGAGRGGGDSVASPGGAARSSAGADTMG